MELFLVRVPHMDRKNNLMYTNSLADWRIYPSTRVAEYTLRLFYIGPRTKYPNKDNVFSYVPYDSQ